MQAQYFLLKCRRPEIYNIILWKCSLSVQYMTVKYFTVLDSIFVIIILSTTVLDSNWSVVPFRLKRRVNTEQDEHEESDQNTEWVLQQCSVMFEQMNQSPCLIITFPPFSVHLFRSQTEQPITAQYNPGSQLESLEAACGGRCGSCCF